MSIVARIEASGGRVAMDEWRLRVSPGQLTAGALKWISEHRDDLAAEVWPHFDQWVERAAIMEFDGGLSRKEAEAAAYRGLACSH